jgi:predicted ABC-type ATPase
MNPDEFDRELIQSGRIKLERSGVHADSGELVQFIMKHPLAHRAGVGALKVEHNTIILRQTIPSGYLASILSDFLRRRWLAERSTFTFETVMSSRDKLDLLTDARRLGYRSYLYYICTEWPVISQQRIANRVQEGGHDVPSDKIISRYDRSLSLLPEAIRLSDRAYLFDNSGRSHRLFAEFESGQILHLAAEPPEWFQGAKI